MNKQPDDWETIYKLLTPAQRADITQGMIKSVEKTTRIQIEWLDANPVSPWILATGILATTLVGFFALYRNPASLTVILNAFTVILFMDFLFSTACLVIPRTRFGWNNVLLILSLALVSTFGMSLSAISLNAPHTWVVIAAIGGFVLSLGVIFNVAALSIYSMMRFQIKLQLA